MSNLMHKVKDALTGHHDSGNKESAHESSNATKKMDETRDAYNSGDKMGMNPNENYQKSDQGASELTSSQPYKDVRETHGSSNLRSDNYGSTGYGSNDLNASGREAQANKQRDQNLGNRDAYGDVTDQTKKYTSDYGSMGDVQPSGGHGHTTHSENMGPGMVNQMEARAGAEGNQQAGQEGFGGAAAGGSSYNAPSSGRRRSSGPHKLEFLNKLDPRVHSSDYENQATDQRGN